MTQPSHSSSALALAGRDALRRGDAEAARRFYLQAVAGPRTDATTWLGLSQACKALSDAQGSRDAIDRALALEPRNLQALMAKGDDFAEAGDDRAASSYYGTALRTATPAMRSQPDVAAELQRAQAMCERYAGRYEAYLRERLAAEGFGPADQHGRFSQSLDLVLGKKQIYRQQPRHYYFPELPQIQFYDRAAFAWLDALEAAAGEIRSELVEILKDPGTFSPYVEGEANRPIQDYHGMLGNPDWGAFFLWKNGAAVADNIARCPATMRALEQVPLCAIPNATPSILFSKLGPGARIPPHHGFVNTRLICHLPLIVPEKCGFRVGNDTRAWVEGKAWLFDDTIEHEAWNGSAQARYILLFDIWRPELSPRERRLVATTLDAVNAYRGRPAEWGI